MNARTAMINRLLVAAPWVTIGALLALSATLPNSTAGLARDDARKVEIARAVREAPLMIGRWAGMDSQEAIPREAQQLLKPNAVLQRAYTSPGGPTTHLLIVHCSDARDMIGHYPPICYPSAGWEPTVPVNQDRTLTVDGMPFPVREYGYKRYLDGGREDVIRVFSAFILPDGTVTRERDDISRQSERLSVAVQGVAQLQVLTSGRAPLDEAIAAAQEILGGMDDLLDVLGAGKNGSQMSEAGSQMSDVRVGSQGER